MWSLGYILLVACAILTVLHGYRTNEEKQGSEIGSNSNSHIIRLGKHEWNIRDDDLTTSEHLEGLRQFFSQYLEWKTSRAQFLRRITTSDDDSVIIGSDLHGRYGSLHTILSTFGGDLVLEDGNVFADVQLELSEAGAQTSDEDDEQADDQAIEESGDKDTGLDSEDLEKEGSNRSDVSESADGSSFSQVQLNQEPISENAPSSNRSGGNRFVFLGDYVDRGKHALEVIVLLLYLEMKNAQDDPSMDKVVLLRGNHETEAMNEAYGFLEDFFNTFEGYGTAIAEEVWGLLLKVYERLPPMAQISNSKGKHQAVLMHGSLGLTALNAFHDEESAKNIHNFALPASTDLEKQIMWETMWSDPMASEKFRKPQDDADLLYLEEDKMHIARTNNDFTALLRKNGHSFVLWDPDGNTSYARAAYRGEMPELGDIPPFAVSKSGMKKALKAIHTSWCISGHRHMNTDLWQDKKSNTGHMLVLSANNYHGEVGSPDDTSNVVILKKDGPTREIIDVPDTDVFEGADALLPNF
eukprot:TRINITY_DN2640_c0_g1_i1.p1 TRINITY_DN2640_c0_g1~~TRINITY_DN2640_c0_g1_i1.p1  ORF type:complete len:525 (+),score=84.61 TRINITY_DN2640_c0_g1_i1:66-1640(+)